MPKFRYDGDEPRYYPSLALSVAPGDVVQLDDAPDERFTPAPVTTKSTPASAVAVADAA